MTLSIELELQSLLAIYASLASAISEERFSAGWHDGIDQWLYSNVKEIHEDARIQALWELRWETGQWFEWIHGADCPSLIDARDYAHKFGLIPCESKSKPRD